MVGILVAATIASLALVAGISNNSAHAAAPVGQGFNLNAGDLRFILTQIKIAEAHAAGGQLLGPGPNQVSSPLLPFGLRTVDGSLNNLQPGQSKFGAADTIFPRLLVPKYRQAEGATFDPDGPGPLGVGSPSAYTQKSGLVFDSLPRRVSNLVVDQTSSNPAAVAAAGVGAVPDPVSGTLFIPNRAPDLGLAAPFNGVFTLFGQFFDHGLDLLTKGGSGAVFMPLQADDPLFNPAPGTPNFMVLTRGSNQPGADGILGTADDVQEGTNTTTPFVDQNQTYTSHPSHQVFLRQYTLLAGKPLSTGKLLEGALGNIGNWADVKAQARTMLGIQLTDADVTDVPLLATDPYGRFLPGPVRGMPQIVMPGNVLVEGDPAANGGLGVAVAGSVKTGHAFLNDIAHSAAPTFSSPGVLFPDTDTSVGGSLVPAVPAGSYDNELLDKHFITGDGRGNENIGLTAIHTVFHAEHNRLVDEIGLPGGLLDTLLTPAEVADWKSVNPASGWGYGERLFQAAKFVTEMEYQHLVFEEFARKVQPSIRVFDAYHSNIDPAIVAEFAHTVYRFGHSMLDETVARTNASGTTNDIPLFGAFLNPVEFNNGGGAGTLTADLAAGSIVRGMSRQVGNEIDEFVTDVLRNRLVGLPLDLPAINIARGRSEGIPSLNSARRQFFAATGNSALAPYGSWTDFAPSLKHPQTLVNLVAAYGTHPNITGLDPDGAGPILAGGLRARRAAADQLVNGTTLPGPDGILAGAGGADDILPPANRLDFMNGTGAWADVSGVTITGLDDVDFWVGGLAEAQSPFGGMLGSTFDFVFKTQLENLQDGDRFYYLSRLAGLNLVTQVEGNTFAELIARNTGVEGLPADVFSRADLLFNLANLGTSGPILDDPSTPQVESTMPDLTRMPDGTIRYTGPLHVVWNGTDNPAVVDRIRSSLGDDTLRGNGGVDIMEGGTGNDQFIGGAGDDILTDTFGNDDFKGGDGNDVISSGPGFDVDQGGRGSDFIVGGADPTETFAGPGNDVVFAGESTDTAFGGDGHDWIEGGNQGDVLVGEDGAPFALDPTPSNDVLAGDGGDDKLQGEGGDDIMVAGPGLDNFDGMLGFDWVTHRLDPQAADSDLLRLIGVVPVPILLVDRFRRVEGLSGWNKDDILRGDNETALTLAGLGQELTAAGINNIPGLAGLLPAGAIQFTGGNIILGGAGSDLIEGRGGNDIIDGDAWLNVQLRAPDLANPGLFKLVDSMTQLRTDVLAGRINPGDITVVRSIVTTGVLPADVDTAVFSGARASYTLTTNADGTLTVAHLGGAGIDGTDTLRNTERLTFSDQTILVPTPPANTVLPSVSGVAQVGQTLTSSTGTWTGTTPITFTQQWQSCVGVTCSNIVGATGSTYVPVVADVGKTLRVHVTASNGAGPPVAADSVQTVVVTAAAVAPPVNTVLPSVSGIAQVGQLLTGSTGTWSGTTPITFTRQWQSCVGATCSDIALATGSTYVPVVADVGKTLRVHVTATNIAGGPIAADSVETAVVAAAPAVTSLVPDPDFELSPTPWFFTNGAGTFTWATDQSLSPTHALKIVTSASTLSRWLTNTSLVAAQAGRTYTARVSAKTSGVAGAARLTLTFWNASSVYLGVTADSASLAGTQDWTPLTVSRQAPAGTAFVRVELRLNGPGSAWFDNLLLSDGSVPPPSPVAPTLLALPLVSGLPQVGQTLSVSTGLWSNVPTSFAYQWLRCDAGGAGCVSIGLATASSYLVGAADLGSTLRARVTASNVAGPGAPATSAQTAVVTAPPPPAPPVNTVLPSVSGIAQVGQLLTGSTGTWSGTTPITFTRQWQSCVGATCSDIALATGSTYVPVVADVGNTLRVHVTATNIAGGPIAADSVETAVVAAAPAVTSLVPDPDFELSPTPWFFTNGAGTFTWATDQSLSPTHALKIVTSASTLSRWLTNTSLVAAQAGRTYTARVSAKTSGVAGAARLTLTFWNASSVYLGVTADSASLAGTQDWTPLTVSRQAPAGTAFVRVELRLNGPGSAWFDNLLLTQP
ncbi:peroxidase family protein [Gaiella occulta]|uniref:peroxidase family protein n=1 Tax=Gaiella occulta TaxID=1002870 RepID=UPI0015F05AA2|nr:peroxidase family protein [Gaiella occulta]